MQVFQTTTEKQIQAASVLVRSEGGRIDRLRLLKLLYIADRESLAQRAYPIIGGRVAALDNGPLHSEVYDLIKGVHGEWGHWARFFANDGHSVVLVTDPGTDELSEFEVEQLTTVSAEFREIDTWAVVEKTHEFPEWIDRHQKGSSRPIPVELILQSVGFNEDEIASTIREATAQQRFQAKLS